MMDRKERETVKCCVPFCSATSGNSKDASFYSFPKEKVLKERWITALREGDMYSEIIRDHGPRAISRMFVCSWHFKQDDFKVTPDESRINVKNALVNRSLGEGAVPSVFTFPSKPGKKTKPTTPSEKPESDSTVDLKPIIIQRDTPPTNMTPLTGKKRGRTKLTIQDVAKVADQMKSCVESAVIRDAKCEAIPVARFATQQPKKIKLKPEVPLRCSPRTKLSFTSSPTALSSIARSMTESVQSIASKNTQTLLQNRIRRVGDAKVIIQPKKPGQLKRTLRKGNAKASNDDPVPLTSKTENSGTNSIIAAALSRLSEVPKLKNRPINRRRWHAKRAKAILPESSSKPIGLLKKQNLGRRRLAKSTKISVSRTLTSHTEREASINIKDPLSNDSDGDVDKESGIPSNSNHNQSLLAPEANSKNVLKRRGRPPLKFQQTRTVSLPFKKRLKDTSHKSFYNTTNRRMKYNLSLDNEFPPERKEAKLVESMFTSAITKVFANPEARLGRKSSSKITLDSLPQPDSSNVYRWLSLNSAGNMEDDDGAFDETEDKFEFGPTDRSNYALPHHHVITMDGGDSDEDDNVNGAYDPLANENGYSHDHVVKVDAVDLADDNEDDYATPLLNGFGIVTDDHHDPIPSSLVEVKTELETDPKIDPEEFAILPSEPNDYEHELIDTDDQDVKVSVSPGFREGKKKNSQSIVMKEENMDDS